MSAVGTHANPASSEPAASVSAGSIYRRLGVEPIINCAGVRTNYGGSNPLPEVLAAMEAAATAFVDMDELMASVGQQLGIAVGAEWGIVTTGSAAALALATASCLTGNDPEAMLALPQSGNQRGTVVMPSGHRFAYDHAIRMTGAEIRTVATNTDLRHALGDAPAMLCTLGRKDLGDLGRFEDVADLCRRHDVPVLVDAAAQAPERPDPWLERGADLVVYAGGKYVRGPQSTGFLLGSKALTTTAWLHAAPHQAWGRPMKVGKEEIVGALVALRNWLERDPERDERRWSTHLAVIAADLNPLRAVSTRLLTGTSSTVVPRLQVSWDPAQRPITSDEVRRRLMAHRPRVLVHDFWSTPASVTLDPFNLTTDEAAVVGKALRMVLDGPLPRKISRSANQGLVIDVEGTWSVEMRFAHLRAEHRLLLVQAGASIRGRHFARSSSGEIEGHLESNKLFLMARHAGEPMARYYAFEGNVEGDEASGTLVLGASADEHLGPVFRAQFGTGTWRAVRSNVLHHARTL